MNTIKPRIHYRYLNQSGFTLVETVVVVIMIAIISSIAIPSFISQLRHWEAKEIRSTIIDSFRTARVNSLTKHRNIILCPANINNECHKEAQDFLIIFSDSDDNHYFDVDKDILYAKRPLNLDYGRIHMNISLGKHYIKFYGDSGTPPGHIGHIKYCPINKMTDNMFQVSLNMQGNHRYKPNSMIPTECPKN